MNYKYSMFNSIVPYREVYALYNSFSGKVIFLEPDLREILQAGVQNDLNELREVHPTFYRYLCEEGFLIDEQRNEIEAVKKLRETIDEDESTFMLIINPTLNCNFQCWYCYESHIRGSRLNSDTKSRINAFITAASRRKEIKVFYLSFFGGEPLLNFKTDNIPILEHFQSAVTARGIEYSISYTTNAYLIDDYFIDFFKSRDLRCSLQITLDGYRDEHDKVRNINNKKGSYDKIINNVKLLVGNEFPVCLRVNYTARNIGDTFKIPDDLADVAEPLRKKFLIFDFHRVWQDDDRSEEVKNVLLRNINIIKDEGFEAIVREYSPNNVVESCYADKRNSVVINYNADIFKCTARDFTRTNREGYLNELGELVWENNNLEKRMNAKFKNKSCLSCRILPLCNGGCSQHALENAEKDYCIYRWDNLEKDQVVTTKIDELVSAYETSEV